MNPRDAMNLLSALDRAAQAYENAQQLGKLAGHFTRPKASGRTRTRSDANAFRNRVEKRRKKAGR